MERMLSCAASRERTRSRGLVCRLSGVCVRRVSVGSRCVLYCRVSLPRWAVRWGSSGVPARRSRLLVPVPLWPLSCAWQLSHPNATKPSNNKHPLPVNIQLQTTLYSKCGKVRLRHGEAVVRHRAVYRRDTALRTPEMVAPGGRGAQRPAWADAARPSHERCVNRVTCACGG